MNQEYYWDEFNGVNASRMGLYLTKKELEFIEAFLASHHIDHILEVGCGSGRLSIPVFAHKIKITGFDIDPVPLKILAKREPRIKTLIADASKPLPFKDNSFDCIMAIESIDYLTNIDAFFNECRRLLAPGGFIIFTSGNATSYKKILQQKFGRHKAQYRFSTKDIQKSLNRAGFTIQNLKGFNWLPFRRESDSRLIPLFDHFEKSLGLDRLPQVSPWIMCQAQKVKNEKN